MTYHQKIQPLVTYMEGLMPTGYTVTLSPSGQGTTRGSLGVTMTMESPSSRHTYEVEEAGAADYYLTITIDGDVISSDSHRGGNPKIPYGRDIVAFMKPHLHQFIAGLRAA